MKLSEKNRRVHARIAELFAEFVESLLRGEGESVRARWTVFHETLREHARLEESDILPRAEALSVTGKGDPRVIRHDHRLLDDALDAIERLLAELEKLPREKWIALLARSLETPARFEQIFEHHTVRECEFLYAAFDERADDATRAKVAAVLEKSL